MHGSIILTDAYDNGPTRHIFSLEARRPQRHRDPKPAIGQVIQSCNGCRVAAIEQIGVLGAAERAIGGRPDLLGNCSSRQCFPIRRTETLDIEQQRQRPRRDIVDLRRLAPIDPGSRACNSLR